MRLICSYFYPTAKERVRETSSNLSNISGTRGLCQT